MEIDDIQGTRPNKLGYTKHLPTKDIMNVRDITGTVGRRLTKSRNLGRFESDPNQDPKLLPKGYEAGH